MGVFRGDRSPRNTDLFTSTSHQRSSGQASQDDEVQKPAERPLFFTTPQRGACKKKPRPIDRTVREALRGPHCSWRKQIRPSKSQGDATGGKKERGVLEIQQQQ